MPGKKKAAENSGFFTCPTCDYITSHRGHWKAHILTTKHKMLNYVNGFKSALTTPSSQWVCHCERGYSCTQGLSRHRKNCKILKKWL